MPAKNKPCPCGSGRNYKGCCAKRPSGQPSFLKNSPIEPMYLIDHPDDEIDELRNSTLDLIRSGEFDAARKNCKCLLSDFEHFSDGHEMSAMLYEAIGETEEAVEHYEAAARIMDVTDGCDPIFPQQMRADAARLRTLRKPAN